MGIKAEAPVKSEESTFRTHRKHAEKTAWYLRAKYCLTLDPSVFDAKNIHGWQYRNLWE